MAVLVTGGTGFVGSRLVPEIQDEDDIICVSNSRKSPYCDTIHVDLANPEHIDRLPEDVDSIVHLAAHVPPDQGNADLLRCDAINACGTMHLLQYAKEIDADNFVYLSSCHYLNSTSVDGNVEYSVNPDNVYEGSKYAGEVLCGIYRDAFEVDCTTLRASYIYGPGMPQQTVVYSFIRSALEDEPIVLYNGGADTTDFVYVDDVVAAIKAAVTAPQGEYVIGSQERTTIRRLAEIVLEVVDSEAGLEIEEQTQPGNDFFVHADDVKNRLGYHPTVTLRTGIREMINESDKLATEDSQ